MMRTILTTLCLLFASMTASYAFQVVKQFTPSNVDSVAVSINDGADDGCWTNLVEAKRYAEDKLELTGFKVRSKVDSWTLKAYLMSISVNSTRGINGCFGSVSFQIYQPIYSKGMYGHLEVGKGGSVFTGQKNANQLVLNYTRMFFDAFP